jgi:choline dehydrogenase-like flavoprotein
VSATRPTAEKPVFCVLGAGNGGMAMAARLALKGFTVNLYDRSPERLPPIRQAGGIHIIARDEELPRGRGRLAVVTATALGTLLAGALLWCGSPAPQLPSPTPHQESLEALLPTKVRVYRSEREPPPTFPDLNGDHEAACRRREAGGRAALRAQEHDDGRRRGVPGATLRGERLAPLRLLPESEQPCAA